MSRECAGDPQQWQRPACDIALVCAAAARLVDCEANQSATARVNVAAPLALAQRVWAQGGFVVFLSSSGIFDGCRDLPAPATPPAPLNAYARQKAAAEASLLAAASGRGLAIVRPTKILARQTPLLRAWEDALAARSVIAPHAWRRMSPLHLDTAADAMLVIAAARAHGIWHLSASEDVDYADFARRWAAARGFPPDRIQPLAGDDPAAQRARLDMTETTRRFDIKPPSVDDTIAALQKESA
ncbi:MAG: sugar nucleotide-binding protein [Rhodocyclales bacterium]|nr:sugar nucleotide-binding protein [Rhodocyclales bacterium]